MQKRYIALLVIGGLAVFGAMNPSPRGQIADTGPAAHASEDGVDKLGIRDSAYCVSIKGVYREEVAMSWRYMHVALGDPGNAPPDYQRSQKSIKINGDLWRQKNCDALGYGPLAPLDVSGKPTWIADADD